MARDTFENWIPEELGSKPLLAFQQTSAVDAAGAHEPMMGDTKRIPRDGGFTVGAVAKGSAYGENVSTQDYVEMIARKIGGVERLAEEDLNDTTTDPLEAKRIGAGSAMAKFFDNATMATTGVSNGTNVLYTSVYKALRTTDATVSYTADANYVATAGVTYDQLSGLLSLIEGSEWVDDANLTWFAHPAFKGYLRGLKDTTGAPIWRTGASQADPGEILGYPVKWSRGLRISATNNQTPTGNALAFIGDANMLKVGDAKLPGLPDGVMGTQLQRAATGVGFLTDEALMKAAMRKGFALGHPTSFAVLEKTP